MMVSFVLYSGFFRASMHAAAWYFSYPLFVMATFVVFYGGLPILRRGLAALRYRSPSMDTLVSISALSSYLYSSVQMIEGSLHLYFDTASMLITFVLLGRYVELRLRDRLSAGLAELYEMRQGKIRTRAGAREKWVKAGEMTPGDRFTVMTGEAILLDGRVIGGGGLVDESLITGEARPRTTRPGDMVIGGSMVREGCLEVAATTHSRRQHGRSSHRRRRGCARRKEFRRAHRGQDQPVICPPCPRHSRRNCRRRTAGRPSCP